MLISLWNNLFLVLFSDFVNSNYKDITNQVLFVKTLFYLSPLNFNFRKNGVTKKCY